MILPAVFLPSFDLIIFLAILENSGNSGYQEAPTFWLFWGFGMDEQTGVYWGHWGI